MKFLVFLIIALSLFGCTNNYVEDEFNPEFVFIITIDGARPDTLLAANTPAIDNLIENHNTEFSFDSRTVCPSITTSAHASLFTGKIPQEHGYYNPRDNLNAKTIFEIFEENGYKTLLLDGKGGRIKGLERGVTHFMGNKNYYDVFENVDEIIINDFLIKFDENKPTLSFILLPTVDRTGHEFGHESQEYTNAIEDSDKAIELLVYYLNLKNIFDDSLIIILSDHGMTDKHHGDCLETDMKIPIIKYGQSFEKKERTSQNITDISSEILNIFELNFNN